MTLKIFFDGVHVKTKKKTKEKAKINETKTNISIKETSREEYHRQLITLFLEENHGTSQEWNYYDYYVETGKNGKRVYLHRPAYKNKGMDFEVRVEDYQFRYGKYGNIISSGNRPSHDEIWNDVKAKVDEIPNDSEKLKELITQVYNCEEPYEDMINSCSFTTGLPLDLLLYTIKWLFIEQDMTYWNQSGREMYYNGLMKIWN